MGRGAVSLEQQCQNIINECGPEVVAQADEILENYSEPAIRLAFKKRPNRQVYGTSVLGKRLEAMLDKIADPEVREVTRQSLLAAKQSLQAD